MFVFLSISHFFPHLFFYAVLLLTTLFTGVSFLTCTLLYSSSTCLFVCLFSRDSSSRIVYRRTTQSEKRSTLHLSFSLSILPSPFIAFLLLFLPSTFVFPLHPLNMRREWRNSASLCPAPLNPSCPLYLLFSSSGDESGVTVPPSSRPT